MSKHQKYTVCPAEIAESLKTSNCPASLGEFGKAGLPLLLVVWVLPEHEQSVRQYIGTLYTQTGYVDPKPTA